MKTISVHSDLPCAVIIFDGFMHCLRKVAYFACFDEAVAYTTIISRFSNNTFAVVFFPMKGEAVVCYYRVGEKLEGFEPEIRYECYSKF